jgi:hypothetical protein
MKQYSSLHRFSLLMILFLSFGSRMFAQCPGQSEVQILITPDGYPSEITWDLTAGGNTVASGGSTGATVCVPTGACMIFTIHDAYGDGICCSYGAGSYTVLLDGVMVGSGGEYGHSESTIVGCPAGTYCENPLSATNGSHTAPQANSYYEYTCTQTGVYEITTCGVSDCDTKVWVYGNCNAQSTSQSNVGTLFYDDDDGGCGQQARVEGYFAAGETYIIRIGLDNTSTCAVDSINFAINFLGEITGCMDPLACNYNPLATIPGQCYFYPDPNCPDGPDLMIDQQAIVNSLQMYDQTATNCHVVEGCMTGYGERTVLAFDTHIKNIGATDYYIGNPANNPDQFTFGNCHGHAHYEGYAEYVLYKPDGTMLPIGQKNGFCVMDLECSGGGSGQYGCGNMGITAGCGDIYGAGLDCQWIDVTDVDTGQYVLAVKVNWDQSPDALGRYEVGYENNWAQVCIRLTMNAQGVRGFQIIPNCDPLEDCLGVPYGTAVADCEGVCNGGAVKGDLDADQDVQTDDAVLYIDGILDASLAASTCKDISADGLITVWDAGLANNCAVNGPNNNNCQFPNSVTNPDQTVTLGYTEINSTDGYIDVYIKNPDNRVVGYEFNVFGIEIGDVENLIDNTTYPMTPRFAIGGTKVVGLSLVDSTIPKNLNPVPLVRIHYSQITDEDICVSGIVHVLNTLYEPVETTIAAPCATVAGIADLEEASFRLFPNPAVNEVTVQLKEAASAKTDIQILDAGGRVVSTVVLGQAQEQLIIPLKGLAPGFYQVKIGTESETFIKQ